MERTISLWLEETLRAQIEDCSWRDLLEYGQKKGQESGYSETDVARVIKEWRSEQRRRPALSSR